ncbi:MAG: leucine-rich repeat domain-containing protein [Capnocytophaga sp.]|nr:leucine-rich repeat domain-containing protein [Capnocytophaga sp.]
MSNIRNYTMVALAMSVAIGCQKNEDSETPAPDNKKTTTPWTELTPATPIYDDPKSVANCNADDVKFLREIAKMNGFEEDFKTDDPSQWKKEHLAIIWKKETANGKDTYFVSELGGARGSGKGITKLDFFDVNNAFTKLEKVELTTPDLTTVYIDGSIPSLKAIILKGKDTEKTSTLEKITIRNLEGLETLSLTDFPSLKTTNDEDYFAVSTYYYNGNLVNVTLNNIGASSIQISATKTLQELSLQNNLNVETLNIEDATLTNLDFNASTYPKLTSLTLKKLTNNSAQSLNIEGLANLTDINISKIPSVTKASVSGCPKVTSLMIQNGNFTHITLQGLSELKTIDLAGNKIANIDISSFSKVTKVYLNDNELKGATPFKLPTTVETLSLQGNEGLTAVDLSPYKELTLVNINGYKKGATSATTPSTLSYLKIAGLTKLERLLANWNALSTIDTDGQENISEKISLIECENNELTPDAIYALKKAFPSLDFSLSGAGSSSKSCSYVKQRAFKVGTITNNQVTFAISQDPNYGQQTQVSLKDTDSSVYQYDNSSGILSIKKAGSYEIIVKNDKLLGQIRNGFVSEKITVK